MLDPVHGAMVAQLLGECLRRLLSINGTQYPRARCILVQVPPACGTSAPVRAHATRVSKHLLNGVAQ